MPNRDSEFRFASVLSEVKQDFSQHLPILLVFDLYFKLIAATILGPVSAWILRRLIATSGAYVIGNEQILSFLLSPLGLATVILSGALTLVIIFAQQAGIFLIVSRSSAGSGFKAHEAIIAVLKYLRPLFHLGGRQVIITLLYLAPLGTAGGILFYFMQRRYDLNYLLVEKPPFFWLAAGIGGLLGVCALLIVGILYLRWIFSVPLCVIGGERPSAALSISRDLVRGKLKRIAVLLLGFLMSIIILTATATYSIDALGQFILARAGENPTVVIPVAGLVLGLYGLVAAGIGFIGFSIYCLIIISLYHTVSGKYDFSEDPLRLQDRHDDVGLFSRRAAVWGIAILTLAMTTITAVVVFDRIDLDQHIAVTAHRGSSKAAPENSLAAIRQAIRDGADFAEIDVQETADGEIVLLHDTDLTRIAGINKKIWQITYPEIKSLDAGSWFSPKFKGEPIPTLAQALDVSRDKIKLNIELKFNGREEKLVERVVQIIQNHNFESRCVVTSLNYEGLKMVEKLNPDLKTGFIIAKSIGDMFRGDTDFLSLSSGIVDPDLVAAARKRKKEVHVWTVNRPERMSYFINIGVDNIITDYPAKLVKVIQDRTELSDLERFLLAAADIIR